MSNTQSKMEQNESKPYILLKFGSIKYADFTDSPEAMALQDKQGFNHSTQDQVELIKLFNGDFHLWWEDRKCSKQEAIDYILNY